ncbi:Piwi-domain-containing protein [Xylariaceae sp. FL0594]|nr:Piwi-domain-containing protein [Xylariaceae sp. FL0594]
MSAYQLFQTGGPRDPAVERAAAAGLDGSSDRRSTAGGSHRGSVSGRSGSQADSPPPSPTDDYSTEKLPAHFVGMRVDLGADAYLRNKDAKFLRRPGYNSEGKKIEVDLNIFMSRFKDQTIYQYDVTVSPNPKDSRALILKVWNTVDVQHKLTQMGGKWLFDGNKLAWSSKPVEGGELRVVVDLDAHKPPPRGNRGVHYVRIRQSRVVKLTCLNGYLNGTCDWDKSILEGMNFFDHCIRQTASEKMLRIRRNFYPPKTDPHGLDVIVEIHKGYYAAPRLSESKMLMINVDTANTAFWIGRRMSMLALHLMNAGRKQPMDINDLAMSLRPTEYTHQSGRKEIVSPAAFWVLRRMKKLKFNVYHRGKEEDPKTYTIQEVYFDPKFGLDGAIPDKVTFEKKMPDGTTKTTTVAQHYKDTYGFRLEYPHLPVVRSTRGGFFPMELCNVARDQRYPFKLSPEQTAAMIKVAVTRPPKRREDIMGGFNAFKFDKDPYLAEFGIQVRPQMTRTKAVLLQNPEVTFGNEKVNPRMSGRWDLRGKRFVEPNTCEITSWGFVVCGNCCSRQQAEHFGGEFLRVYKAHGGRVTCRPKIVEYAFSRGDYGEFCKLAWNDIGVAFKKHPDIIFFIVPDKNMLNYERIKKNMDCRFITPSQVLHVGHVKKCNAQYISNVAMKVNAKLGGSTCRVTGPNPNASPFFKGPTMIIGMDVTHHSADTPSASIAAMTMSIDKFATRYMARVEANGPREEVVRPDVTTALFPKMLKYWMEVNGTAPVHVYYLRDGTDEGQFEYILKYEVGQLRRLIREANVAEPKFTVIIATKRHHIRFFPQPHDKNAADRNGNPLPGTLVERDATHPRHFDFYLCSHVAIQGTARPVHYQVLVDEAGVPPNHLQKMLYHQCYQYVRSTTPVSLHPAVYYAHLAAGRAKSHENVPSSRKEMISGKEGFPLRRDPAEVYAAQVKSGYIVPLLPMSRAEIPEERSKLTNTAMWYI